MSQTNLIKEASNFSGEQVIIGQGKKSSEEEHIARYQFTSSFVSDKEVLDVACGTGYGSEMIKCFGAKKVFGVDISPEIIAYARKTYDSTGIEFIEASATLIPLQNESIDIIVSFETIEHLTDADCILYLDELSRVLKKGGLLLLSTPNRRITSPNSKKPLNRFHFREYTLKELEQILWRHGFQINKVYGQRVRKKIFTFIPVMKCVSLFGKILGRQLRVYDKARGPDVISFGAHEEPRYYVITANRSV